MTSARPTSLPCSRLVDATLFRGTLVALSSIRRVPEYRVLNMTTLWTNLLNHMVKLNEDQKQEIQEYTP